MSSAHPVSSRELLWIYRKLSNDSKNDFLVNFGRVASAKEVVQIASSMGDVERHSFGEIFLAKLTSNFSSVLIREACRIVRKHPEICQLECEEKLALKANAILARISAGARERLKQQRDPKARNSDRDDEIVRLHDIESKSFGQIGAILLSQNPKWTGKNGAQLDGKAVQAAYHRKKRLTT